MIGAETADRYAGFISYSHRGDALFAEALQREVERFARPWNRLRAIRLFRDETNLTASAALWGSIEEALSSSRWLVILASPTASGSEWVGKEIQWWVSDPERARRVLLVLTDGELAWDSARGDFDLVASTALHPALSGVFAEVPLWVDARWSREAETLDVKDPRMQRTVVDVASTLRGLQKDMLVGEAVREQKRTKRLARAAVTSLAGLTVVAVVAGIFAWVQRDAAVAALHVSESRQLAALAQQSADRDLSLAATLALSGEQLDVNAQTDTALAQAATSGAMLSRVAGFGGAVDALATGTTGDVAVVGLAGGEVVRWDLATGSTEPVAEVGADIRSLAASADGTVVVATTEIHVVLMQAGQTSTIELPSGLQSGTWSLDAAVSPDGSRAWVGARGAADGVDWFDRVSTLCEVDLAQQRCTEMPVPALTQSWLGSVVPLASDDSVLTLFDPVYGAWARLDASTGAQMSEGSYGFGTYQSHPANSPDGAWLGVGTHDSAGAILLWSSAAHGESEFDSIETALTARTQSVAISPSGDDIAVSYLGGISLVRAVSGSADGVTTIGLDGVEDVKSLLFQRDGQGLLGIRDDRVFYWGLAQTSRVPSEKYEVPLPGGCAGCSAPTVYISPDESQIVGLAGSGDAATLVDLDTGQITEATDTEYDFVYAKPTWANDGRAVLPVIAMAGGAVPQRVPDQPGDMISWERPTGDRDALDVARSDDNRVISIDTYGVIRVQDPITGEVEQERGLAAPEDITYSDAQFRSDGEALVVIEHDALSSDATRVLKVDVTSADATPAVIATGAYESVAWQQDTLLIQDVEGVIEVRSAADGAPLRSFTAAGGTLAAADSSGTTSFAAIMRDDKSIDLIDTRSGAVVTTYAARTGSLYDRSTVAFMPLTGRVVIIEEPTGYPNPKATLTVYDLAADSLVDAACRIAWTQIVPDRWGEFVPTIAAPTGLCS